MSSSYEVVLTEDAAQDLQELYDYIAEHDAPAKADHVLERIEAALEGLARMPQRGAHTKELLAVGMREYRETYFKPYRIVYRVIDRRVYVYLIVDGRRDMQTLLQKRVLRG
ncbi:type II toxin-antitoxin system RelE/ParE family toxin [Ramlibacter sp.]|uniref:type II toxin-antitoxin system RelE/ParE family toxin n=1 Tax=Ramlibacter sp. TaxID=1917967 RepID=UPI0017A5A2A3|nr:type II toxin-antitoxin system RelE/ParE family toxin [Ramlibacter sp.]MBA2674183.1 type II toxin-antitoxin system RelE/ParE family toxin [Ramlibacter sp.]